MFLAGCAPASGPDLPASTRATTRTLAGDWDDIDSAVIWGADRAEWVVHKWWWADASTRLYELRSATGVSAMLRIHRDGDGLSAPLRLTASVGPLGDAAAEDKLIDVVGRRLEQLRGRDVAPLD